MKKVTLFASWMIGSILSPIMVMFGQEPVVLGGRTFFHSDTSLYIVNQADQFKVDETSITIKCKPGTSPDRIDSILKTSGATIERRNILGYVDLKLPRHTDIIAALRKFMSCEFVEVAEPNSYGYPFTTIPPPQYSNDTYFDNQWYLNQSSHIDIAMNQAWGFSTGSPSVTVAILDYGFDWRHEDIGMGTDSYQNVWLNSGEDAWTNPNDPTTGNHVDDDADGFIDDWKGWNFATNTNDITTDAGIGHGTVMAGIICAKTNNNKGISGIAGGWNCPGVKMLGASVAGVGGYHGSITDDGILFAVAHGAKVITICFTVDETSAINAALDYAYNHGCVVVAASGNNMQNVPYPANRPTVIAVSGMQKDGSIYSSGYLPSGTVSVCAFAGPPLNSDPNPLKIFGVIPGNQYQYLTPGTSWAAPQVAGVAALLLSVNPTLSPEQIRCILEKSATDAGAVGYDQYFGWGRLNAYHALQSIRFFLVSPPNYSTTDYTISPSLSWTTVFGASSYRVQVSLNSNFANPVVDQSGITSINYTTPPLDRNRTYYWHVKPDNDLCGVASWSDTWQFTTPDDTGRPDPTKTVAHETEEEGFSYKLVQNFPNPFNPVTVISYQLPVQTYVTLKVYSILGQEVATLVSEVQGPGKYDIRWDASELVTGIYTYRLVAGQYAEGKKMLLAR